MVGSCTVTVLGVTLLCVVCVCVCVCVCVRAFQGKMVLVAANLKPRAFAGLKSHGMVMCASNQEHTKVELLVMPEGAEVGERVMFEGHPGEPAAPGPFTKKKVLEKMMKAGFLVTNADCVAVYKGEDGVEVPFTLSTGVVKSSTLTGANVG